MASTCPVCRALETSPFFDDGERRYFRCSKCEATFVDPSQLPGAGVERSQYDLHENQVNDPGYRKFLSKLAEPLVERLPKEASGLDYGCGPGPALAAMLEEAGHHVSIYDPFYARDEIALGRAYDFITCTEVVEHFHKPADEFDRLNAMLKPGGLLAVMTCFQTEDEKFGAWYYRMDPTHVVFYREETFRVLAGIYGWRISIPRKDVVIAEKIGR